LDVLELHVGRLELGFMHDGSVEMPAASFAARDWRPPFPCALQTHPEILPLSQSPPSPMAEAANGSSSLSNIKHTILVLSGKGG
jgi:hypothetical protein